MEDDEIMRKSGIYRYVLSGDLRNLSFRTFDKNKSAKLTSDRKEFAYIATSTLNWRKWKQTTSPPWKEGGTTIVENCQMLCKNCNRIKGGK